ncbi:hypothetical protein MRX96_009344 [Rhipicephalus microplus]
MSLDEMWSHRVYHYGQVNTPPILTGFDTFQYVTQSAKGLQSISLLMKDRTYSGPSYTVLHYPLTYESMAADVAKVLTLRLLEDDSKEPGGSCENPQRPGSIIGMRTEHTILQHRIVALGQASYSARETPSTTNTCDVQVNKRRASQPQSQRRYAPRRDLLVAFGYIAYGDYGNKDCRVVPPLLHSTELLQPSLLNGAYPVRLLPFVSPQVRVISALATLKKQLANTTALAVSLGMGGRWYIPAYPDKNASVPGNYSLGHHCKMAKRGDAPPRDQISSIEEACEDSNYNQTFSYDRTFEAMFAYDKSEYLFTYDSADSFRIKICETKKNFTGLNYNLVADDIQYDDINDSCGYGGYSRLHILNRLAAFVSKKLHFSRSRK